VIKSADKEAVGRAVASYIAKLRADHPEVERVIWFGSWVIGLPTLGSDVDLCLILSSSDKPMRHRIPGYLPLGFPVGIDLFAYTRAEFDQLRKTSPGWYATIMSGRDL
jgi:predicted nucleotidyltransferase